MTFKSIPPAAVAALIGAMLLISRPAAAQEIDTLIKAGDQLYKKRSADIAAIRQATAHWQRALDIDPSNALPACNIAMAHHYLSRFAPESESKSQHQTQAIQYAQKALGADPEQACGHYWTALLQYEQAQSQAPTQFFRALGQINAHLAKAKSLNKEIYHGGPDRLMGRIAYTSPIIKTKEATEHLEAALAVSPDYYENLIDYAEIMIKRKRFLDARGALNKVLNLKSKDGDEKELRAAQQKAEALLDSIKAK